mmetsp:Transcript_14452/g.23910  ORF Transcript_14452/g.23910 Transcript_14452/m.23910 type:complete len:143 (-) Transcript_14452:208-636(-)|eukprot:CAMPEP_0119009316 /NCGR_PEP_ID=MMETSP1176-20130426/4282_1 /TAXON_ID=265551 /ORGANISM="Synedropsis recta cf, Strain CCMP1620" /LENGTH=142 /DNA_ID=CAMNT_0006961811 /DNA_START=122 /DNA_END=550 /DNA_ORIENTATION=+
MKLSMNQATRVMNQVSTARVSTSNAAARSFSSQECFSFYPSKGQRSEQLQAPQHTLSSTSRECFSYYPSSGKRVLTATTATLEPLPIFHLEQAQKPVQRTRYNKDVASQRWVADVAMQFAMSNRSSTGSVAARAYHNKSSSN